MDTDRVLDFGVTRENLNCPKFPILSSPPQGFLEPILVFQHHPHHAVGDLKVKLLVHRPEAGIAHGHIRRQQYDRGIMRVRRETSSGDRLGEMSRNFTLYFGHAVFYVVGFEALDIDREKVTPAADVPDGSFKRLSDRMIEADDLGLSSVVGDAEILQVKLRGNGGLRCLP